MRLNPNYVPKERKLNKKILLPLVVLLMVGSVFGFKFFQNMNDKEDTGFKFCNFSSKETADILKNRQESVYSNSKFLKASDYNVYGETLKFYHEPFSMNDMDVFIGNTVFLNNLCGLSVDDKVPFLLSHDADIGIQLSNLQDGFYELEILKDFDFHLLEYDGNIDETFTSIKRNGEIKQVRILSDIDLYNKNFDTPLIKKQMLFLEVSTVTDNDVYDIVLDPSALNYHDNGMINYGHFSGDTLEADEMYRIAEKIKTYLERYGLRVYLTRDSKNAIDYFGEKGRLSDAYDSKAKYYIHLRFESSGHHMDRGLSVFYSNQTSNRFASNVAKQILNQTSLTPSPYEDGVNMAGVYQTSKIIGTNYDYNNMIRETGGRITGAGQYDIFYDLMAPHRDSKIGMHAIDILYGYMTDASDYKAWTEELDEIVEATAKGILIQLGIEIER